jgi:hypothetical protein
VCLAEDADGLGGMRPNVDFVAGGIRRHGQKVLLAVRDMGGESEARRSLLDGLAADALADPSAALQQSASAEALRGRCGRKLWPPISAGRI